MGSVASFHPLHPLRFPARLRIGIWILPDNLRRVQPTLYTCRVLPFEPHPWLRNRDLMTMVASKLPRKYPRLPAPSNRYFETEPGTKLLGHCFWQPQPPRHPTLIMVHGLEGSAESSYMRGAAEKAWAAGFSVVLLNQRNCGGTEHLSPTLYNSGLSGDYRAVLAELIHKDGLPEIFICGYSMGGNLVLKMAGEMAEGAPAQLRGVVAVCPSLDLAGCADLLHLRRNAFYEWHFVRNLKRRYKRKVQLFPEKFQLNGVDRVRSVREFDDLITAPYCGYGTAANYYLQASALRVAQHIRVPTLILAAEDDPFIPGEPFRCPAIQNNPHIQLEMSRHGGHCGFISRYPGRQRFWAEARIVEFCKGLL